MTINHTIIYPILQKFAPQMFVDTVTMNAHLYNHIKARGGVRPPSSAGGPVLRVKVGGTSSAAWFAEGSPAPATTDFTEVEAEGSWGLMHDTMSITGKAKAELEAGGSTFIEQPVLKQTDDHLKAMAELANTGLLGGVVANGLVGLTAAIDDSNTYMGINRAVYATWGSYINDAAGVPRSVSMALMDATHDQFVQVIGGNYDEIWTSSTQANALTSLSSGNGIITAYQGRDDGGPRVMGFSEPSAIPGIEIRARYRGRNVLAIPNYPSGRIDFVDSSQIWIEELKPITVTDLAQVNADLNYYFEYYFQVVFGDPRMGCASLQDLS